MTSKTISVAMAYAIVALARFATDNASAQTPEAIEINIVGNGVGDQRFDPKAAAVMEGQSVRWINQTNKQHSARSINMGSDGLRIFDTGFLKPNGVVDIVFDRAKFQAAGVPPGGEFLLNYECEVHPSMTASIMLQSSESTPTPMPEPIPPAPAVRTHTIDALVQGVNFVFTPSLVGGVQVGDVIVWRNAAINPGPHGIAFPNWSEDRTVLSIVPGGLPFDENSGMNTVSSSEAGAVLLIAEVKEVPSLRSSVDYYCTEHGPTMNGVVSFNDVATPVAVPEQIAVSPPVYRVVAGLIGAFDAVKLGDKRVDSYFALSADINADGLKDIVTSGLGGPDGQAMVSWYENPSWTEHFIGSFDVPVALDAADVDRDGNVDLAICYDYGACIFNCKPENGRIDWLHNPGPVELAKDKEWPRYHIGVLMATHRLRFGHFTSSQELELLAVPVVGGTQGDIHAPIRTLLYSCPADPLSATGWPATLVNDSLRVIHEIATRPFLKVDGQALDSVLTASEEGVTWIHYDGIGAWQSLLLGEGEKGQIHITSNRWKGSGALDVGATGGDPFAYIAATEPFHGNILSVYTKSVCGSLESIRWQRRVVDVFGPLNNRGEGAGHDVCTADIDGDGDDEVLVGLRGPSPYSGVQIYKVENLEQGRFTRQQVSAASAAQVVVDDFDNDGRPDFVTIPYRVLTYVVADDTEVMLYLNRTPQSMRVENTE